MANNPWGPKGYVITFEGAQAGGLGVRAERNEARGASGPENEQRGRRARRRRAPEKVEHNLEARKGYAITRGQSGLSGLIFLEAS